MKYTIHPKFVAKLRQLALLILVVAGLPVAGWAQPSIQIDNATVNTGQNVCIPIRARDFSAITLAEFSVQYDPVILDYTAPSNINPTLAANGFTGANIVVNEINGTVSVTGWSTGNCGTAGLPAVTLPDDAILFELCFDALGAYGEQTRLQVTSVPTPIRFYRSNVIGFECFNIGLLDVAQSINYVTIGLVPPTITVSNESGNVGDQVCVDFVVEEGWDQLISFQFTVNYDPTFLAYQNLIYNNAIPNLGGVGQSFGVPGLGSLMPGEITCTWSSPTPSESVSVADGTLMFQVCFDIIGDCESSTEIVFGDSPTFIEITNEVVPDFLLPFVGNEGTVTTGDCNPTGIQLTVDCGDMVDLNDQVCVQIQAGDNFNNVRALEYIMEWNPAILEFVSIVDPNSVNGLDVDDFNTGNVVNGVLGLDWSFTAGPMGVTLAPGTVLYEVCFMVVGLGGDSPMNIITPGRGVLNPNNDIGINPTNCVVKVTQPGGVGMFIGNAEAGAGDQACVPISVTNFKDIIDFQFSLNWDPTIWTYQGVQAITLMGATAANFNTAFVGAGGLVFEWANATGVTVPDGDTIFEICFTPAAGAAPGDCDQLEALGFPLVNEAITTTSNGENVGVIPTIGELCVLYPEGFGLFPQPTTGLWRDTVCMPFTVESFDNITETSFTLAWDPSDLQFVEINNPATWPGLNFDLGNAGVGSLSANFANATSLAIADGTVVFELCFSLIGQADTCFAVSVQEDPAPTVSTSGGPGSLISEPADLCILDRLILDSVQVVGESCPGRRDGQVRLFVSGGRPFANGLYGTTWETSPATFEQLFNDDLPAGPVAFTVFDLSNPALSLTDTIDVPLLGEAPIANAGEDRSLPCDPPLLLVNCNDSQATDSYSWRRIDGSNSTELLGCTVFIQETGLWELTRQNAAGCIGRDTMRVTPPVFPLAEPVALGDTVFLCTTDSLAIGIGPNTSVGPAFRYSWEIITGGPVNPATQDDATLQVYGPGRYRLTVRNQQTGCETTSQQDAVITDGQTPISVNAGLDQEQNCDGTPAFLDGSNSNNDPLVVTFAWFDPAGVQISDSIRAEATQLGIYTLVITDLNSGCTGEATVSLLPNINAPSVAAGDDQELTCTDDMVTLTGTVNPVGGNYSFQWTPLDGGALVPGTETMVDAQATLPGLYELRVTNQDDNCVATDTVLVSNNLTPPLADAGADQLQNCQDPSVTLDGSASAAGDTITYQWYQTDLSTPIADATMNTYTTSVGGLYLLEVTNANNGCTSVDTVVVNTDGEVINIVLNFLEGNLTCANDTITISAELSPDTLAFTAVWEVVSGGGTIIGPVDGLNIQVDQPGTYRLSVTRDDNGCVNEQEAIVEAAGIQIPSALIVLDTINLTCLQPNVRLDGTESDAGAGISYLWTNIVAGEAPTPADANAIIVATPGIYELQVIRDATGCVGRDTIVVADLTAPPALSPREVASLTCNNLDAGVELAVLVDGFDNNFTVNWTGLDGGIPDPVDQLTTTVRELGRYEITVRNGLTGCVAVDTLTVIGDITPPSLQFGELAEFTCTSTSVTIDASSSGPAANFSNIDWEVVDPTNNNLTVGANPLIVTVDGPGQYRLTLTLASNGCSADSLITVNADQDTPQANAGADLELECGETSSLDGSASSQGPEFSYTWTLLSGDGALSGNTTGLMPMVTGAGLFQLVVSNANNGCTDTATVNTTLALPENAAAGADLAACADSIQLTANLPAGVIGAWTTTATATIAAPDQPNTAITGLTGGANVFVWTLSAPGCLNYSSDTVVVQRALAPVANDDFISLTADVRTITVDLTANDILNGASGVAVSLLTGPAFGRVDTAGLANGIFTFSAPPGIGGSTQATYQICNLDCPELCATGRILIEVEAGEIDDELPNTITPNGDGLNDLLVFDIIEFNPADKFPDNELVVFSRWGDIVFQAKPYTNNWGGLNNNGEELPEGTYYYILRLDISEGVILHGDITIVR